MVYPIRLNDRVIPYHPVEHRDTIHNSKKIDYIPIFYSTDSNRLNYVRTHLWQEAYIYLSKIPKLNLLVKRLQLPSLLIEGR